MVVVVLFSFVRSYTKMIDLLWKLKSSSSSSSGLWTDRFEYRSDCSAVLFQYGGGGGGHLYEKSDLTTHTCLNDMKQ